MLTMQEVRLGIIQKSVLDSGGTRWKRNGRDCGPGTIVFSDCYEKSKGFIEVDGVILAAGRVTTREGQAPKLIVSSLLPLSQLSEFYNCRLVLALRKDHLPGITDLLNILQANPGEKEVLLIARNNGEEFQIRPRHLRVTLSGALVDNMKERLGETRAYLIPM
jgi:hypothetical protein